MENLFFFVYCLNYVICTVYYTTSVHHFRRVYTFNKNLQRDVENMFAHVLNLFLIKREGLQCFLYIYTHVGIHKIKHRIVDETRGELSNKNETCAHEILGSFSNK